MKPDFAALAREGCEECPHYRQFTNSTYKRDLCFHEDVHDKVAAAMKRAFVMDVPEKQAAAQVTSGVRDKPIWKWFAWAALLLLLIEPAIVNRLKR